jgi:molybdopterin-guanine dinucleotide biosynthesis protein A
MKLIITLSGKSKRFTDAGYKEKSFIRVLDKYVIEHVREMYKGIDNSDIIFVVRNDDWMAQTNIPRLFPGSSFKCIPSNTDGPVVSILNADLQIPKNEEVLISYCDFVHSFDFDDFINYCRSNELDGCVTAHKGFHPYRLYNKHFAFMRNNGNKILEIKEKESFTDNIFNEYASNGSYYFSSFGDMNRFFESLVRSGNRSNGEFYVTMTYNEMINLGMKIYLYETKDFVCLGTPQDIELTKAWKTVTKLSGAKTESEKLELFKYWSSYYG